MDPASDQCVLWCGRCNKPFTKQATLKRHGYYCRSRRRGPAVRLRSCVSCAQGKLGCDNKRPTCSRCSSKGITCQYPAIIPEPVALRSSRRVSTEPPASAHALRMTHFEALPTIGSADSTMLDDSFVLFGSQTSDLSAEYQRWDYGDMDLTDFASYTDPTDTSMSTSAPYSPILHRLPQIEQVGNGSCPEPSGQDLLIPLAPTRVVRSLIQRPRISAGSQRIANLILSTLRSYPLMLRHNNLPPFVHPLLLSSHMEGAIMEPLTNCISLIHMISGGVRSSRKLFWDNVRRECQRFIERHRQLDRWELLGAMQALFLYILIRLEEGETDHNNLDTLLVDAVIVIAQQICRDDIARHTQCAVCNNGLEISWQEWVFRESRRRLAIVYRVVNKLVYFEPAAMCGMPDEFILAPLPAKRQLWEARDECTWRAEGQRDPSAQTSYGLATDGELIKLDSKRLSCSDAWLPRSGTSQCPQDRRGDGSDVGDSRGSTCWDEWCAGIDSFGGLVVLAASFIA